MFAPSRPPKDSLEFKQATLAHKEQRGRVVLHLLQRGMAGQERYTVKDMTCNSCMHESYCDSAWDLYNTNGDCLESK